MLSTGRGPTRGLGAGHVQRLRAHLGPDRHGTDADRLLAEAMGLPRGLVTHARADTAPTGFAGVFNRRSGWWNLTAAREVAEAEPNRRIVWIDDDLAVQAADTTAPRGDHRWHTDAATMATNS